MTKYHPAITTEPLSGDVPEETHAVEIEPGKLFVGGVGLFETKSYRVLAEWEAGQLTFVFPYLFEDMAEEYEHSLGAASTKTDAEQTGPDEES